MFLLSLLFSWVGFFVVFFFCIDLNIPFENWSLCSFNDVKYKRISYDQWMNITMIDYMKKESLKILVVGRLMNCKYLLILMCFASSSGNKKNIFFRFDPVFYPEQYIAYITWCFHFFSLLSLKLPQACSILYDYTNNTAKIQGILSDYIHSK